MFEAVLTRIFHELPAATTDVGVLPGRPRVSVPATYRSGTPRNQHPAGAGWPARHAGASRLAMAGRPNHLLGLATANNEISGLEANYDT